MAYVLRTSVSVNADIIKEDILQYLRNAGFIFRSNDKAGTNAVAADFLFSELKCCVLCKCVNGRLCTCISCGAKVAAA